MTLEAISEFFRSLWGVWLMVLFLGIVFYAFRPRNKDRLEEYGNIPLRDDDDKER
ncbi:cbb3-type cytochrome oxidase subunit 3 [Magnetospirillum gryphiswaldense]|jgi:cytochrome c oxidase cbb3-type subunit 4|uniref:Cb-type cytochrome c oxidase CcoQ subunit n=2 Tax=Magnetospirillum gryphiswaldense TaxID=55518 RepID=V6F445_MAGGM|nr:cbb3-type cytochrome c oxidase subunit 3 [Magnetospirillum gryphiswaldense]AVM75880.1 Cbb3-type cytochrome oxidase component FixQ [Magnetospirillum gryphiswaldense MSR-1]AVM79783.1 Cbb3-type cytochrome oxidase component FixQ [Magnetospirillum gryphiswaldense]CDL00167.1 putative Cb-type cytochrome c oxidase CcoQ subunit [Magnetospirillum gryphiswaldense MSR-1 v2]